MNRLYLAIFLLVGVLTAHAQAVAPRTIRFIGTNADYTGLQMQTAQTQHVDVAIPAYGLSRPYPCPPGAEIKLTKVIPAPSNTPGASPTRKTVASIPLPDAKDSYFVIVVPDKTASPPYPLRGTPIDDSYEKYPTQSLRLINLSPIEITVKISGETHSIATYGSAAFPFPSQNAMNSIQIAIYTRAEWKLGFTGTFAIKPTQRAIAIAYENPNPPTDDVGLILVNLTKERPPKQTTGE
jgi:hypothetical protein